MSGAEAGGAGGGGGGFTFNFFGGGNGGGAGPSAATTADNKAASSKKAATAAAAAIADSDASDTSDASDADADAEEERAQEAAAEAAADALLAAINEEGPPPGGWAYREAAEELEGLLPALAPSPSGGGAGGGDDSAGGGIDLVELPGCGGLALAKRRVASGAAAALLGEAAVTESDLVPGRYEGGFKLWEGGVDLAAYVARLHGLTAATLLGAAGAPPATGLEVRACLFVCEEGGCWDGNLCGGPLRAGEAEGFSATHTATLITPQRYTLRYTTPRCTATPVAARARARLRPRPAGARVPARRRRGALQRLQCRGARGADGAQRRGQPRAPGDR